jgi:hypothetical protein
VADRHERDQSEQREFATRTGDSEELRATAHDQPGDDGPGADFDLGLVQADDALLDALAGYEGGDGGGDLADQELSALLLAWRRDVDSVPIGEVVDTDTAVDTIAAGRLSSRRRPRLLVPVAAAAAVLVITFGGVGIAARDAQPGDALWGLTRVLYADHARSIEAAAAVLTDLSKAESALGDGRMSEAKSLLDSASQQLVVVSDEDGKDDLRRRHQQLSAQLPGGTGTPGASDPSNIPPGSGLTTTPGPSVPPSVPPSDPSTPPSTSTPPPTSSTAPSTSSSIVGDLPSDGTSQRGEVPGDDAVPEAPQAN